MRRTAAIVTWNVLHGVHGVNWSEPTMLRHPDETLRIKAIARRVYELACAENIVALQEVSGDQLAAFRQLVPVGHVVLSHRAPRMPKLRVGAISLADRSEHLVVVAPAGARVLDAAAYPNDPGKGFLAAQLDDILLVNTHVTFAEKRLPQLERLATLCVAAPGPTVVVGDFNASAASVLEGLPGAKLADVSAGTLRTRTGDPGHDIDHVAAFRASVLEAQVLDGGGLSDHNPVRAIIALD